MEGDRPRQHALPVVVVDGWATNKFDPNFVDRGTLRPGNVDGEERIQRWLIFRGVSRCGASDDAVCGLGCSSGR